LEALALFSLGLLPLSSFGSDARINLARILSFELQEIVQAGDFLLLPILCGNVYFSIVHPVVVEPLFAKILENTGSVQYIFNGVFT